MTPTLASKTLLYWELSSSYNGRITMPIAYETAIRITGDLLDNLDPHRPLALRVRIIDEEIVHQTSTPKAEPCSVTQLRA